jgi:hypothetical protein
MFCPFTLTLTVGSNVNRHMIGALCAALFERLIRFETRSIYAHLGLSRHTRRPHSHTGGPRVGWQLDLMLMGSRLTFSYRNTASGLSPDWDRCRSLQ